MILSDFVNAAAAHCVNADGQETWETATPLTKSFALAAVAYAGASAEAPAPSAVHQQFLSTARAQGWTWSPEYDCEAKRHPAYLPWPELTETQQERNCAFLDHLADFIAGEGGWPADA